MEVMVWFLCVWLALGEIHYFSSVQLQDSIKFLDGGRDSAYYVGTSNNIHPMFIENGSFIPAPTLTPSSPITRLYYSTANIKP